MLNAEYLRKRKKKLARESVKRNLCSETNLNILPDDKKRKQRKHSKINNTNFSLKSNKNCGDSGKGQIDVFDLQDVYRNDIDLQNYSSESIIHPVQKPQVSKTGRKKRKTKTKRREKSKEPLAPSVELLPTTRRQQLIQRSEKHSSSPNLVNKHKLKENNPSPKLCKNGHSSKLSNKSGQSSKLSNKSRSNSKSLHSDTPKRKNSSAPDTKNPILETPKSINIRLPYITPIESTVSLEHACNLRGKNAKRPVKKNEYVSIKQRLKAVLEEENRLKLKPKEYTLLGKIWEDQTKGFRYL